MFVRRVTYIYRFIQCPTCKEELRTINRQPRFGPPAVKCANCGFILKTAWKEWTNLSPAEKLRITLQELIAPSYTPRAFLLSSYALLFIGVIFLFSRSPLLGVGFLGVYGVISLLFFKRMLDESNTYSQTLTPPRWGAVVPDIYKERGEDLQTSVTLSPEEAWQGVKKEIVVRRIEACPRCNGSGIQATLPMRPCETCRGKKRVAVSRPFVVQTPPQAQSGDRVHFAGEGGPGKRGGPPGDFYVSLIVSQSSSSSELPTSSNST